MKAVTPKADPVALPTMLDPGDIEYQRFMLDKIRSEQQGHQSVLNSWTAYLGKRYGLGPTDRVDEAGKITRVEPEKSEPKEPA